MKEILILGGGRVGSAIAYDLCTAYSVTVADINKSTLKKLTQNYNVKTRQCDCSNSNELTKIMINKKSVPSIRTYCMLN